MCSGIERSDKSLSHFLHLILPIPYGFCRQPRKCLLNELRVPNFLLQYWQMRSDGISRSSSSSGLSSGHSSSGVVLMLVSSEGVVSSVEPDSSDSGSSPSVTFAVIKDEENSISNIRICTVTKVGLKFQCDVYIYYLLVFDKADHFLHIRKQVNHGRNCTSD